MKLVIKALRVLGLVAPGLLLSPPARAQFIVQAGYQVGRYTSGLHNLEAQCLELNRSAAHVDEAMRWSNVFQGPAVRLEVLREHLLVGLGWSNRHIIRESSYTDAAGVAQQSAFRVRLNELNFEAAYPLLKGKLRPGGSMDLGLFRFDRRDSPAADFSGSEWHPFHSDDSSFLSSGRRAVNLGFTVFVDVVPLGKKGGGPTFRPYYQWSPLTASMFGRYGTFEGDSYDYRLSNFGLAATWGFAFN